MTEMIVTQFNIGSIIKNILINLTALTIIWGILVLNRKIRKIKIPKNALYTIFAFFVLLNIFINSIQINYVLDYMLNNITEKEIYLDNFSARNHITCYIDGDNAYYFDVTRDKREMLEEYFVGHNCTIEYYKWSKMVWKIKLIE